MRDRFLVEAPGNWQKYVEFAEHQQGGYHLQTVDLLNGNRVIMESRCEIKQSGMCQLRMDLSLDPRSPQDSLVAVNSKYAFKLARGNAEAPWIVTRLEMGLDGPIASRFAQDPGYRSASPFLHIGHPFFLPELIKDENFLLNGVRLFASQGEQLVRLDFDYHPTTIENNPERGGWALLDPGRYWIVREFELQAEWPDQYKDGKPTFISKGTIWKKFEFEVNEAGFPVPTRIVRRQRGLGPIGPADLQSTTEHKWRQRASVPETEFTLTAFGLPEPKSNRHSILYLWLAGSGALCAAVATWLRARLRRKEKSA